MNRPMELDIWGGDWGLPSIDLHCLQVMAYAKFSGVPLQTRPTNNPFRTPNGTLPVFRHGNVVLSEFNEISSYLRKKNFSADFGLTPKQCAEVIAYSQLLKEKLTYPMNFSADFGLTPKQCAEVVAYSQLLKEKLYPGLQYVWWIDSKNYLELTRPWYAKALPLPYNYYYPGRYERQAKKMIEALYEEYQDDSMVETAVYGEAEKCLTALSVRLGETDFFYGSHPTSLDAVVYGYIAPLLKAPFPNPTLQNHLKACSNLVKFVVRISQRYFPHVTQEYEAKKSAEDQAKSKKEAETDFPNKRRNQFLAGLFATVAMTGYALSTGLVEVSSKEDELQEHMQEHEYLFDGGESTED